MAYEKKTWKDRQVQYPNRKTITNVDSGESITADVIRDEGIVTTEGDLLNAANLNDLENRIEQGIASSSGGGGSDVGVTPILETGVNIAKIRVDTNTVNLYAPESTEVSVKPIQTTGTKIATVTVDDTVYSLFAPQGGGGGGGDVIDALYQVSQIVAEEDHPGYPILYLETESENAYSVVSNDVSNPESLGSGSSSGGSGSGSTKSYKSTLITDPSDLEYTPLWVFLSTFDENCHWDVYYNHGTRNLTDYYEEDIVYHDSGYVTNKLIYVPAYCNFQIHYTIGDGVPAPEIRCPAALAPFH